MGEFIEIEQNSDEDLNRLIDNTAASILGGDYETAAILLIPKGQDRTALRNIQFVVKGNEFDVIETMISTLCGMKTKMNEHQSEFVNHLLELMPDPSTDPADYTPFIVLRAARMIATQVHEMYKRSGAPATQLHLSSRALEQLDKAIAVVQKAFSINTDGIDMSYPTVANGGEPFVDSKMVN